MLKVIYGYTVTSSIWSYNAHLQLFRPFGRYPETSHSNMRASSDQVQLTWWTNYQSHLNCKCARTLQKRWFSYTKPTYISVLFSLHTFWKNLAQTCSAFWRLFLSAPYLVMCFISESMEKGGWEDGRLNKAKWLVKAFCISEPIGSFLSAITCLLPEIVMLTIVIQPTIS